MAGVETKSSLSSNVLQMKFMKRSALRIEQEKSEDERQHIVDDIHWVLDLPATQQQQSEFLVEPSIERCENLVYGRMSFKGFNPDVEKLMVSKNTSKELEEAGRRESETSLTEKEMAKRYESLVGTISNKFKSKRDRKSMEDNEDTNRIDKMKRTFKKPADD